MPPTASDAAAAATTRAALARLAPPRWARVEKIRLIRREIRESLGAGAVDVLLGRAEVVVEGDRDAASDDGRTYATLMITIDLPRCADRVREPADAATAERLTELLGQGDALHERVLQLARSHLARLSGHDADDLEISLEISVRHDNARLLVDGDAVGCRRGSTPRRRRTDRR